MSAEMEKSLKPVIGLEIHAQLTTRSKMFCGCRNRYGEPPNSLTCPVCLGLPGALPVINRRAVEYAMKLILAVGGEVNRQSVMARKNYFYPDLPKGYQISQYQSPIGRGGEIGFDIGQQRKKVRLIRIHLEEDAGKLIHPEKGENFTRVDLNRCGVPLLEIVTEPELESPAEARAFLIKLRQILQYLEICSGDMEKGALRCDANVSLAQSDGKRPGIRTELKNLNSFRAVENALAYEITRQTRLIQSGKEVMQETLLWDEAGKQTQSMRGKEEAEDYRYFAEPNLYPIDLDKKWTEKVKSSLPESPDRKIDRFIRQYKIPVYDAAVLAQTRELADYFESAAKEGPNPKSLANWLMGEVLGFLNQSRIGIGDIKISPKMLGELLRSLESDIISGKMARVVFEKMLASGKSANEIIEAESLRQIADPEELSGIIRRVLEANEKQVRKYREGKTGLFHFFVGRVMKETDGKAKPEAVNRILRELLDGG